MNDAKPIFVIKLPGHFTLDDVAKIQHHTENKMKDYHVLICRHNEDDLGFECFYNKDIKEVEIEELKEMVRESAKGVVRTNTHIN